MRGWAIVENDKPLQCIEVQTPEPTGTQVLLEVTHCGVCHSDLHIWDGHYDLGNGETLSLKDRGVKLPLIPGHEIVGRVSKLGPKATGVKVGDLRVAYPWVGCGTCEVCIAEDDNLCMNGRALGVMQNGGYASHVLVPHARFLVDPGSVDPSIAATYACSGITVFAAIKKVMPLSADEPIVVIGAGGLGMNAIAVLRALGHRAIVIVDVSPEKRAAALEAGATTVIDGTDENVAARIVEACGHKPWAIIDLVNGSTSARFALDALRKGGTLVQVGLFGGGLQLRLPLMAMQALTIRGSYVGTVKDLRELMELAKKGKIAPLPVKEVPLDKANEALNKLRRGDVAGRLVLRCD